MVSIKDSSTSDYNKEVRIKSKKQTRGWLNKTPFSVLYLSAIGLVVFSITLIAEPQKGKSCNSGFNIFSSALAEGSSSQCSLFVEPVKNIINESPEMTFIQENSIIGVCTPTAAGAQVLGSIVENDEAESRTEGGVIDYIAESDDTIESIAKKFGISVNTIIWANNLSGKNLKTGQQLVIPPVSGVLHLVRDGDKLGDIAKKYKADEKEIIAFNQLGGDKDIYVGDLLVVPNGAKPKAVSAPKSIEGIPLASSYFIYPCEGLITQGPHGAFGAAIDIADKCGKPIVAAAGGTVQRAGAIAIGGNIVTILHPNGVVTYYGHLSVISTRPGQKVNAGDIVGYMGRTGYATGCHLHFEVRGATNFLSKLPLGAQLRWKK